MRFWVVLPLPTLCVCCNLFLFSWFILKLELLSMLTWRYTSTLKKKNSRFVLTSYMMLNSRKNKKLRNDMSIEWSLLKLDVYELASKPSTVFNLILDMMSWNTPKRFIFVDHARCNACILIVNLDVFIWKQSFNIDSQKRKEKKKSFNIDREESTTKLSL